MFGKTVGVSVIFLSSLAFAAEPQHPSPHEIALEQKLSREINDGLQLLEALGAAQEQNKTLVAQVQALTAQVQKLTEEAKGRDK